MRKDKEKVCHSCYAYVGEKMFKKASEHFERNSKLFSESLLTKEELPYINKAICRFNAFGELINDTHLLNLFSICNVNPHCLFALWTKRVNLVNWFIDKKPANLILIYSSPYKNKIEKLPFGFDKTFTVFSKPFIRDNNIEINCAGHCIDCRKCYSRNDIVEINESLR
jgi:hypothetical protein